MNSILIFIETQSSRRDPMFVIKINDATVQYQTQILSSENFVKHIVCEIEPIDLKHQNKLCLIMQDKVDTDNIDPLSGNYVDHFISVKQIRINDVDADSVLFGQSYVEHSMSPEWVEQMKQQGHEIHPRYQGNDLHLNGCMTFEFEMPFWLFKVKSIDQVVAKKSSGTC